MCGICGFTGSRNTELLFKMTGTLAHRGPDDEGFYYDDDISLGHRRLSIIDLVSGHQPIYNEDRSVVVVLNGEIYNYAELTGYLKNKGHLFSTNSDTEVIAHAYEEEGIECVKKFNGCFAFAIYDTKKKLLFLVRDRLGIRPLYYYHQEGFLAFASEVKALLEHPLVKSELDYASIDEYLTLRYVTGQHSMFKDILRLPPASILKYSAGKIKTDRYWDVDFTVNGRKKEGDIVEEFIYLLTDAVRLRMRSDVPIGAYLSGGLDSSSIVALMNKFSSLPVKTYTIGFGTDIDETGQAREMAKFLGTEHHQILQSSQSYELLRQILWHLDEPIGDAIIIPTYLLAQEASRSVKVVLTGEGADEMLAGYIHHTALVLGQKYRSALPAHIRDSLTYKLLRCTPAYILDKLFPYPASLGRRGKEKFLTFISALENNARSYLTIASVFSENEKLELYSGDFLPQLNNKRPPEDTFAKFLNGTNSSLLNRVINLDRNFWLPDYTLFKQDRLNLAHGLEGRVPFLDHRITEFCAHIPESLKLRGFTSKYLLRAAMKGKLPPQTIKGKKKAFYLPTEKLFKGKFDEYVRELLNESAVRRRGLFNYDFIKRLLKDVRSSELLTNKQVMVMVILEHWMKIYVDNEII